LKWSLRQRRHRPLSRVNSAGLQGQPTGNGREFVARLNRGTLLGGTEFDSSYKRNEPATFLLNGVIKCWTEGVQKMKPGGKSLLVCPSKWSLRQGRHRPLSRVNSAGLQGQPTGNGREFVARLNFPRTEARTEDLSHGRYERRATGQKHHIDIFRIHSGTGEQ
jgi:hypothetical protein